MIKRSPKKPAVIEVNRLPAQDSSLFPNPQENHELPLSPHSKASSLASSPDSATPEKSFLLEAIEREAALGGDGRDLGESTEDLFFYESDNAPVSPVSSTVSSTKPINIIRPGRAPSPDSSDLGTTYDGVSDPFTRLRAQFRDELHPKATSLLQGK